MNWGNPTILFLLWLVPVTGYLVVRANSKRKHAAKALLDETMAARLVPAFSVPRTWTKAVLLMLSLTAIIVALARPRFGTSIQEVQTQGADLIVALDVSRSMLAADVRPNRLARAKSDLLDLLERLGGDRIGLIAFAGAPVTQVPLTTDHDFFRLMLDDVDTNSAPRGGTMIGDAIRKALASMDTHQDRDRAIVLITDGGDQDSFPLEAARQAAERNVRIITVGLGDVAEGARIPKPADNGGTGFVLHEGQEVWAKMDEDLLKEIATTTGGAYVPAQTLSYDLGQIYDDHLVNMTRGTLSTDQRKRFNEQFQWFVAIGITLLVVEFLVSGYTKASDTVEVTS